MLLMLLWCEWHLLRRLINFDDIVGHVVGRHRILRRLLMMMMRLWHHVVLLWMLLRRVDGNCLIVAIVVVAIRWYVLWMCNELMMLVERGEFHGRTARLQSASERRWVR